MKSKKEHVMTEISKHGDTLRGEVFYYSLVLESIPLETNNTSTIPTQLSQLIWQIQRDKNGERFEKLCYCGQGCRKIPEALSKLYGHRTHSLDLSYNDLVTLNGLETFVDLRELVLDNNQLGDSLVVPQLVKLHTLSLNKNKICNLEPLLVQIRVKLPLISYLSLLGNRACPDQLSGEENDEEDYQRYRYFVLFHLPNLKFLDSNRVTDQERREAKNRGKFMNVIRPNSLEADVDDNVNLDQQNTSGNLRYTPLPRALRSPEDYKGV